MLDFPQYRKYKNDLSYFKIVSEDYFIEWKRTGSQWEKSDFKAQILPDRNYINDMLYHFEPYWSIISEEDYEAFLATLRKDT